MITPAETYNTMIHRGVSEEDYNAGPEWKERMRASVLWHGKTSMLALKAAMDNQLPRSDAMKFGTDYHCRLLEPAKYKEQYAVMPPFEFDDDNETTDGKKSDNKGTKYYKAKVAEWKAANNNATPITQVNHDTIEAMAGVLLKHPFARILHRKGGHEVSIAWECMDVPCKVRIDKLILPDNPDRPAIIVDLKKVGARKSFPLSDRSLKSTIRDYGYYFKAAFYMDAVKQATGRDAVFIWLFQQDAAPYDVAHRAMRPESWQYKLAKSDYLGVLHRFKHSLELEKTDPNNAWPGIQWTEEPDFDCLPEYMEKETEHMGVDV